MRVGIDIIEVSRIKKAIKNDKFLDKILTSKELEYAKGYKDKESHIAGIFSAKEAVMKALKDNKKISFKDIVISHDALGAPMASLTGEAKRVYDGLNAKGIEISISQTKTVATAICEIYF